MALANPYEQAKRRSMYNNVTPSGYAHLSVPEATPPATSPPASPNPYTSSGFNSPHTQSSFDPRRSLVDRRSPPKLYASPRKPAGSRVSEDHTGDFHTSLAGPKVIISADPVIPDFPLLPTLKKHANYNMKLVVVGDGGCGKTCLLVLYAQQEFPEIYVPTVFENYVTNVETPNHKVIELALWDTAGQEEYDRLRPLSYPNVDVLLVCFSLELIVSLQNVKDTWFPEVQHFCPGIPIILVGTKADLPLQIPPDYPIQVATDINAIGYIQCSAKNMFNIRTVFNFALNHFQKQMEMQEQVERSQQRSLKRLSRLVVGLGSLMGSLGINQHSRQVLGVLAKLRRRGTLYESAALLDQPLMEDTSKSNPYGRFANDGDTPGLKPAPDYLQDEFAFTRENKKKKTKKSKRCTIL